MRREEPHGSTWITYRVQKDQHQTSQRILQNKCRGIPVDHSPPSCCLCVHQALESGAICWTNIVSAVWAKSSTSTPEFLHLWLQQTPSCSHQTHRKGFPLLRSFVLLLAQFLIMFIMVGIAIFSKGSYVHVTTKSKCWLVTVQRCCVPAAKNLNRFNFQHVINKYQSCT